MGDRRGDAGGTGGSNPVETRIRRRTGPREVRRLTMVIRRLLLKDYARIPMNHMSPTPFPQPGTNPGEEGAEGYISWRSRRCRKQSPGGGR